MSYYFRSGNVVNIQPSDALDVLTTLPAATYTVKKNEMTGQLFLQTVPDLELPPKVYGDVSARTNRVIRTFHDRVKSTGVILTGEKGSGKTLLSKNLSVELLKQGVATIIVNEPFCGPVFNELISNIKEPAMVFFDEFEKVYDEDDQKMLLTLLDGTVMTKKLFVLTTNSRDVDAHLQNRPGRIFYSFEYDGLEENFIREYAADNLKNKANIESTVTVAQMFATFTFDMLAALIEEMNRFDEPANLAIKYLNMDIKRQYVEYKITLFVDGQPITNTFYPYTIDYNPAFGNEREITIYGKKEDDSLPYMEFDISKDNFAGMSSGGVTRFMHSFTNTKTNNKSEITVILEKVKHMPFDYTAF